MIKILSFHSMQQNATVTTYVIFAVNITHECLSLEKKQKKFTERFLVEHFTLSAMEMWKVVFQAVWCIICVSVMIILVIISNFVI